MERESIMGWRIGQCGIWRRGPEPEVGGLAHDGTRRIEMAPDHHTVDKGGHERNQPIDMTGHSLTSSHSCLPI